MSSISLTKNRIYARAYVQFHQFERTPLLYEYGTTKFWFHTLGIKQLFTNNFGHNIISVMKMRTNKDFDNRFRQWAGYVRKDIKKHPISLLSFYKLRSDIYGNFGILFGIKKPSVQEIPFNSTIDRYEVRCIKAITFKQMTHAEVPLANVEETKKIFGGNKIKLPVLPIELSEIYCNSLNYEYLGG